jgi:phosphinothricin acetyltransferase
MIDRSAPPFVRGVEAADFSAIAELTNHYIATTAIHFGYEPVDADALRDAWWPKRDRYPYVVAVDADGRFLGYAKSGPWRERAAYQWSAETGIYVVPESQGRGIGAALSTALIDRCHTCGFHSLIAGVTLPNEPSMKLHIAVGFREVARFARAGWKFGAWHDVAFLQLMLRDADHVPEPLG